MKEKYKFRGEHRTFFKNSYHLNFKAQGGRIIISEVKNSQKQDAEFFYGKLGVCPFKNFLTIFRIF